MTLGSAETRLIVVRGNSGAGKSTVAAQLRAVCGRGLVGADDMRSWVPAA